MLNYIKSSLGWNVLLKIGLFILTIQVISLIFNKHVGVSSANTVFIIFISNFVSQNKKSQFNNISWILPLSRRKLWLSFYVRTILFIVLIYLVDTFVLMILKKSLILTDENLGGYAIAIIFVICLYNFILLKPFFERLSKELMNILAFLISFSVMLITFITVIILGSLGVASDNVPNLNRVFVIMNFLVPIIMSYYVTMRTKNILDFRIG